MPVTAGNPLTGDDEPRTATPPAALFHADRCPVFACIEAGRFGLAERTFGLVAVRRDCDLAAVAAAYAGSASGEHNRRRYAIPSSASTSSCPLKFNAHRLRKSSIRARS